ncbi:MAG: carbohydrate kinase family protein, partial [Anaerolineae bacterium]|nr:carbohydrate kinase family protein [Anaerolineae bacterium]
YRSGLLTGLAHGWNLKLAGEIGALCATYVLEQVGTQSHNFTPEEFVRRFRTQFDDAGLLDELLVRAT